MKKTTKEAGQTKQEKELKAKISTKVMKTKMFFAGLALTFLTVPTMIFAEGEGSSATAGWNTVMEFILTWVPRLGGVLLFIGATEFAIAYKNEDANSKTNAVRLMVAGGMVIGIPIALKSLLLAS